jgi:serine protease Do
MDQIISNGKVSRAAIGVSVQNATANDAEYVGLPDIRGVLVQDFSAGSPAKKAGIVAGDIIISVDGKPVEYVGQLQQQVGFRKPGEMVKIEVARKGGVRKTFEVKLQEVQAPRQLASSGGDTQNDAAVSENGAKAELDLLGLTVQQLDQSDVEQLDLQPEQRGLLITDVTPGGPSQGEVAEPDTGGPDILLAVEDTPVKTIADLRKALKDEKAGDIVTLRLYNVQAKSNRIERIRLGE